MAGRTGVAEPHLRGDLNPITRVWLTLRKITRAQRRSAHETVVLLRQIPGVGAVITTLSSITPLGWATATVGVVGTAVGLRFRWVEVASIGLVALVTVTLALLWSLGRAGHHIALELGRQRVTVGDRAVGQLKVTNPTKRPTSAVTVELSVGHATSSFQAPRLDPGQEHDEIFGIATNRRGVVSVGPASTVRGDALGMIRRVHTWSDSTDLYIHPRTVPLTSSTTGFIRDVEGATTQDLSSADVSFHALRDYVPGDDLRNIHWRTTARIGKLMVRQFEETRRAHLLIVLDLDVDSWENEEEFEMGVSAAASLARSTLAESKEVTIHTQMGPMKSATPILILDSLAGIDALFGAERLPDLAQRAGVEAAQASTAVVITGSKTSMNVVHAALARLPLSMLTTAVCMNAAKPVELRTLGGMPVVSVPTLDDLAVAMRKALG